MERYRKKHKVIALWNSYNSLSGSDYTNDEDIQKAMDYCLCAISNLGYNINKLPMEMNDLKNYLEADK